MDNKIAPPITVINPFNKHQPQLLIKDNLEASELPFWKVFRNKSIFNEIFSKFKLKRLKGYYDLQCTTQFLNNYSNSINIIIDNIKCNNNYFHHHQIINNKNDIKNIITSIKHDNQETRSFYNLLFSTYSTIIVTTTDNEWIQYMIENSNSVVLDQFINYFKIDKEVVIECLNNVKFSINNNSIEQKIEFLKYLFENGYITLLTSSIKNKNIYIFKLLISTLFMGVNKIINLKIKLKSLLNAFNLLVSIYQKFKDQPDLYLFRFKMIQKLDNLILLLELNEIITTNEDQLDTSVIEYLDSTLKHKEIIYKLFKSINLFDTFKEPGELRITKFYFKDKEYLYNKIKDGGQEDYYDYFDELFEYTFRYSKNDRLELVSSLFEKSNLDRNIEYFDGSYTFKIIQSNDLEIIDLYCKNVLKFGITIEFTQYLIKSKQILEYYISNYELLQFGNEIEVFYLNDNLIEYYEELMKNSSKLISIGDGEDSINLTVLYRIIKNPSIYSCNIRINQFNNIISSLYYNEEYNEKFLFILSNIQLKQTLNIDPIIDYNLRIKNSNPSNSIIKFLFQNISNDSITNKIKFNNCKTTLLEFTISAEDGISSTSQVQYEYEAFIISKPKSITFSISIYNLLLCLYYLDRSNDILNLINTVPEILETDVMDSNINSEEYGLYGSLSTHYLELFINYFIDNLNEITIKHLYKCLCVASKKGNITLFKLLISTQNYCDYLFKIKTESNIQSLFDSQSLIELVKISTNLNLKNLLLKYINFSENHLKLLK